MRLPQISVIIPVYKAEKHLSAALESLLRQTDDRWEAICIHDGSPDNSAAILNAYAAKDSRFHIIHQQNQGVSAARNTGISHAQGDIVTFLDADDWFSEALIEQLLCPFEVPDVDIVLFEASTEYEPGMPRQPGPEKDHLLPEGGERTAAPCYIQTVIGTCWAKAFRRNFLLCHQLMFPLGMRFEDEVFHRCSMAVARKVFFLKKQDIIIAKQQILSCTRAFQPKSVTVCTSRERKSSINITYKTDAARSGMTPYWLTFIPN